jgi:hypothetical protein
MFPNQGQQSGLGSIEQMHETGLNMVANISSTIVMPVEMLLRPWHGTRYYPVTVRFFSACLMILLPAFMALTSGVVGMIPFTHMSAPKGLFGIGSLSELYFLLMAAHNIRLYLRMIHPERESHSEFEGPPLPFFYLLPKGQSFWFTRIVWEPVFVLVAATVLQDFLIVQPVLATFLRLTALCLFTRSFISWYRSWEFLRRILDQKNAGPAIARLVDNTATQEDLAPIHLASFPKNIDPDIRRAAAAHIARIYSPENINA